MSIENWQEMFRLLEIFERESIISLRKISRNFELLNLPFDEEFRLYFMRMSSLRLNSSFKVVSLEHENRIQMARGISASFQGNRVENQLDFLNSIESHSLSAVGNGNSIQLRIINDHEVDVEDVKQERQISAVHETILDDLIGLDASPDTGLDLNNVREDVDVHTKHGYKVEGGMDMNIDSLAMTTFDPKNDNAEAEDLSQPSLLSSFAPAKSDNRERSKCQHCRHVARSPSRLVIHQRIHDKIKPFKCHLCNYASNQKVNLNTHLRTHSNIKRFKCTLCDYACKHKVSLQLHSKRKHGQNLIENHSNFNVTDIRKAFRNNFHL